MKCTIKSVQKKFNRILLRCSDEPRQFGGRVSRAQRSEEQALSQTTSRDEMVNEIEKIREKRKNYKWSKALHYKRFLGCFDWHAML